MSENKHTPGPWVYSHNDFWHAKESNLGQFYVAVPRPNSAAYDSETGQQVAWLPRSPFLGNTDSHIAFLAEAEANARLISAAPDLLEALQVIRMSAGWDHLSGESQDLIAAALSKAQGTQS